MTDESNEVVTRCAPRWAWDLIDETLSLDANSKAFDRDLRQDIERAQNAMVCASEHPEFDNFSKEDVDDWVKAQ